MIAFVNGILEYNDGDTIVISSGGVGYQIMVPLSVSGRLPHLGSTVMIHTYMSVREDAVKLYGFYEKDELDMFKKLVTVSGIGPKVALGILSVLTPDDITYAVLSDDIAAIAKAPGIGKKTAGKLILELKDKVDDTMQYYRMDKGNAALPDSSKNDAVMALVSLGYSHSDAVSAVNKAAVTDDMTDSDILKAALKYM